MPEYINKQQILEKAKEHQNNPFGISVLIAEIENAKGVDIVFCKECKKWTPQHTCKEFTADRLPLRGKITFVTDADDFCSYGERRDAE